MLNICSCCDMINGRTNVCITKGAMKNEGTE
nr:MAG TPA: hypothetical protein [Caudoviricetes sp.]